VLFAIADARLLPFLSDCGSVTPNSGGFRKEEIISMILSSLWALSYEKSFIGRFIYFFQIAEMGVYGRML